MVVIQNIINDVTVDEKKLKHTCEQFMQELDVGDSELVVRLVSSIEIQALNKAVSYTHLTLPTILLV